MFLCGPIRGLTRKESLNWRKDAEKSLMKKFNVLHALRGREEIETFKDPRAAVIRDLNDINDSNILLVNDMFPVASMIGTSMEVFYAHSRNIPVIIFGLAHEKDYWLNYHSHLRVKDLSEACEVLNNMFS